MPTDFYSIQVPCGKCPACLKRKQNQWAFRIMNESKNFEDRSYFITLTYMDSHLPISPSGKPTLSKKDISKFLHDFRQYLDRNELGKIRYFICGEYGDKFGRPHYHAILFTERYFTYQELQTYLSKSWKHCIKSEINIGSLTPKSAQYCAKYSLKRFGVNYEDCQPPFCMVSKRPFLGSNYLTEDKVKYMRKNLQFHDYIDSTPYSLPRVYLERLFTQNQRYLHTQEVSLISDKHKKYLIDCIYDGNYKMYALNRSTDRYAFEEQLLKSNKQFIL